jgi:hypothetical protein
VEIEAGTFICECCALRYPIQRPISANVTDRMHRSNQIPTRCARCAPHHGDDPATLVDWANDHARFYWEDRERAVEAAKAMRREVEEMKTQLSDKHERMLAAYRSRDHGTRLLRDIGDLHAPVRGGCSCGKRPDCKTAQIIDRPWVQDRLRDLEHRERQERLWDDYDEDDDLTDSSAEIG